MQTLAHRPVAGSTAIGVTGEPPRHGWEVKQSAAINLHSSSSKTLTVGLLFTPIIVAAAPTAGRQEGKDDGGAGAPAAGIRTRGRRRTRNPQASPYYVIK